MLDGNGFTLTKPSVNTEMLMMTIGYLPGVHMAGIKNVTIMNLSFEGYITGITIKNSSGITISQNTIQVAKSGIAVLSSSDIAIIDNKIVSSDGSFATGIYILPSPPEADNPTYIRIEKTI